MSNLEKYAKKLKHLVLCFGRQIHTEKTASSHSLLEPIFKINELLPAQGRLRALIISPVLGVPKTLASTNYFLNWLIGLRKVGCDARISGSYQSSLPMKSIKLLWSDGAYYPNEGGVCGCDYLQGIVADFMPNFLIMHGSPFFDIDERLAVGHMGGALVYLFAGELPEVQVPDDDQREKYCDSVVNGIDGIITMTQRISDYWVEKGLAKSKIFQATSLVDTEAIHDIAPSEKEYCALYFGNLVYQEVFDLVDISVLVKEGEPDFRLDLFGDASDEQIDKFKNYINEKGAGQYIFVHKPVGFEAMISIEKSGKVLLFPGRSWIRSEAGFPNKLGEYLATGTPVVGADVGGINGLFTNGIEMFLAKPGDNNEFAEKIAQCLNNHDEAIAVGRNGAFWAKGNIDCKKVASDFLEYMEVRNG